MHLWMACFLLLSRVHDLTSWRQSPALLTLVNNFIDGGVLPTRHSRGGISLHHWITCFFPTSGVHDLTSCQQSPALLTLVNNFIAGGVLPTRHSRGGISLHHWATCFFPTSGVHDSTLHRRPTPQASPFPPFPGYSPPPYGSWAPSHAELFLRSRECAGFPEKKEMWSAELSEEKIIKEKPRLHRNRSFSFISFQVFCTKHPFSFFERKSRFLLRRNSFCRGRCQRSFCTKHPFFFFERKSRFLLRRNSFCRGEVPKILRNNLLRTFLCTFSTALAFKWIDRCKVVFQCNSAKFTLSYAEAAADTSGFADTHNVFTFIF